MTTTLKKPIRLPQSRRLAPVVKKHRLTLLVITDWVHHDATRVVEDVRRDILTDKIGTLFEHVLTTPGLIIVVVVLAIGVETFCKKEGA
jgi:hypothetical protein